jgi:acetyl esterase/lipase
VRFFGGTPRERPQAWLAATPWTALRKAPTGGTWVLVGRTDPLLPDARRYAAALRAVGRPVHLVEMAPDGDQSLISPRSPEGRLVVTTVVAAGGRP